MADDEVRPDPAGAERRQEGEARRHEHRLLHLGLDEILQRRLEAEADQVEAGGLAATPQDVHRLGHGLGDLAAHARLERALPGEAESDLAHAAISSVHSIKLEPHVRPAPIPVMSTSLPGTSRPSRWASTSASGMDPDDVLP